MEITPTRVVDVVVTQDESSFYLRALKSKLAMNETNLSEDEGLSQLIAEALDQVGKYCSLCLQPSLVSVSYASDGEPLPVGPVRRGEDITITPSPNGSTITFQDYTTSQLSDGLFPSIIARYSVGTYTVAYSAGYSKSPGNTPEIPAGLVGAVLQYAFDAYLSAGVSSTGMSQAWKTKAASFRRFNT